MLRNSCSVTGLLHGTCVPPLNKGKGWPMAIVDSARPVVGGVDTHLDCNVAAVVDMNGGLLGVESFPTTAAGHRRMSSWMSAFGLIERVGIEGTGAYGAGLARHFTAACDGDRGRSTRPTGASPARQERPTRRGRSRPRCPVGSCRGSRSLVTGTPKRCVRCSSRNARHARHGSAAIVQLRHLIFTGPDDLRARLGGRLSASQLVNEAAKLRPRAGGDVAAHGVKTAAVILGRRVQALDVELAVDR